jgi:hypothetical protein
LGSIIAFSVKTRTSKGLIITKTWVS